MFSTPGPPSSGGCAPLGLPPLGGSAAPGPSPFGGSPPLGLPPLGGAPAGGAPAGGTPTGLGSPPGPTPVEGLGVALADADCALVEDGDEEVALRAGMLAVADVSCALVEEDV